MEDLTIANMPKLFTFGSLMAEEVELPAELKERLKKVFDRYQQAEQEVGEDEAVRSQRTLLEEHHRERLWQAACWRDSQMEAIEKTFLAEQEQVEREWEQERDKLRERLTTELSERRRRLLEERDRLDAGEGVGGEIGSNLDFLDYLGNTF